MLVPLKSPRRGKQRLRQAGVPNVTALVTTLARNVILACHPRVVYVACGDPDAERVARDVGAVPMRAHGIDLSSDVGEAYRHLSATTERITVIPADLALPDGLGQWSNPEGIAIVPDRHGTGTNLLSLPSGLDFVFRFGPDSAQRHIEEAQRLGVPITVVSPSPWAWDVDEPGDIPDSMQKAGS